MPRSAPLDVSTLLAGPRGRRVCLALLVPDGTGDESPEAEALRLAVFYATYELDPGRGTSVVMFGPGASHDARPRPVPAEVARLLAASPVPALDGDVLLQALAASVDNARYWQEPDGEDVLAADPATACYGGKGHLATHRSPRVTRVTSASL